MLPIKIFCLFNNVNMSGFSFQPLVLVAVFIAGLKSYLIPGLVFFPHGDNYTV